MGKQLGMKIRGNNRTIRVGGEGRPSVGWLESATLAGVSISSKGETCNGG